MLYVRIRSLNAGRTAAEFKLDGAPDAIEAALAGCRTPPGQTPAPTPKQTPKQTNARATESPDD